VCSFRHAVGFDPLASPLPPTVGHGISSGKQSWTNHNIKPHHWVKKGKRKRQREKEMGRGAGEEIDTSLSCYCGPGESPRSFAAALTSS